MRTNWLVLALVVCMSGCGGSGDKIESNPDLKGVNDVVRMVGDTEDEDWPKLFVEGSAPADVKPYDGPIFAMPPEPKVNISGDTAEVEVLVISEGPDTDGDGINDEIEQTVTWTAQKVGEKWLIKSAPLP